MELDCRVDGKEYLHEEDPEVNMEKMSSVKLILDIEKAENDRAVSVLVTEIVNSILLDEAFEGMEKLSSEAKGKPHEILSIKSHPVLRSLYFFCNKGM